MAGARAGDGSPQRGFDPGPDAPPSDPGVLPDQAAVRPGQRALLLLSGGIDSPVASNMLLSSDYNVDFIHFTTDIDKLDNIIKIRDILCGKMKSKIYVIDFKLIQEEIVKKSQESYRTLMYKVFMIIIANNLAKEKQYNFLATGNSLSQGDPVAIQERQRRFSRRIEVRQGRRSGERAGQRDRWNSR